MSFMPIRMVRSFQSSSKFRPWGERQQGGGGDSVFPSELSLAAAFTPSSTEAVLLYLVLSQRVNQMSGLTGEITETSEQQCLSKHRV